MLNRIVDLVIDEGVLSTMAARASVDSIRGRPTQCHQPAKITEDRPAGFLLPADKGVSLMRDPDGYVILLDGR
jgi:hypothetical protein